MTAALLERDHRVLWHPCSQMKDYETFKPLHVVRAQGSYIETHDGRKIIDAISSWWCKSLGHNHPQLKAALTKQMEKFEHVILANTTNEIIVELSEKLAQLSPNLNKVFYAGDGSSAVEIALKMTLHARHLQNQPNKKLFVSLKNSYHGDTIGALSVSDLGLYRNAYEPLLFETHFISPPYLDGEVDGAALEKQLEPLAEKITAVIIEPIVQGTAGMKIYDANFLKELRAWTKKHDIHLIADEIMTGIARTGKMLACEHADIVPDFLCLSKGLTSGWLPLSAMLTTTNIYDLFYDDYKSGKSFLHSHTFSGNALAASVALEVLNIVEKENYCVRANEIGKVMHQNMQAIAQSTKCLRDVRQIGAIVAADLITEKPRAGFEVYQQAMKLGALLRPLGNTIYWLPPLNTEWHTLEELKTITEQALLSLRA